MNNEHPLKVCFPYGGKYFLCHWWSYDEQCHVIVAPSETSLNYVAKKVFEDNKNKDVKIKGLLEVEIVAPSHKACEKATKDEYKNDIEKFLREITWKLIVLTKEKIKLPNIFSICEKYEGPVSDQIFCSQHHYDCKNCVNELILNDLTAEQFYLKYNPAWKLKFPSKSYIGSKRIHSKAAAALDDEKIWAVVNNLNSLSEGVAFREINSDDYHINALFYFRKIKEIDTTLLQSLLVDSKDIHRLKQKMLNQAAQEDIKIRKQKELEELLSLLK